MTDDDGDLVAIRLTPPKVVRAIWGMSVVPGSVCVIGRGFELKVTTETSQKSDCAALRAGGTVLSLPVKTALRDTELYTGVTVRDSYRRAFTRHVSELHKMEQEAMRDADRKNSLAADTVRKELAKEAARRASERRWLRVALWVVVVTIIGIALAEVSR